MVNIKQITSHHIMLVANSRSLLKKHHVEQNTYSTKHTTHIIGCNKSASLPTEIQCSPMEIGKLYLDLSKNS